MTVPLRALPARDILLVDDVPQVLDAFAAVARRLRSHDVRLVMERSSRRALDLLAGHRFDLVVSDFRMPCVDGLDVLARARETSPDGVRALVTGYRELPTDPRRVDAAGLDALLLKPLHAHDLLLTLADLLSRDEDALRQHRDAARLLGVQMLRAP